MRVLRWTSAKWRQIAMVCGMGMLLICAGGCEVNPATSRNPSGPAALAALRMPRVKSDAAVDSAPLTPALWAEAEFTPLLSGPLPEPRQKPTSSDRWKTRARLAWDPNHLFVMFESVGPAPQSNFTHHDDLLHQADAVEIFLDVAGDRKNIVEVQVNPKGTTADYYHVWTVAPTYAANQLNDDFYRAHHKADRDWDLKGLRVQSSVEMLHEGQARWTVMMALPLAEPLTRAGLPPALHAGQALRINLLRYAYDSPGGVLTHFNLVPVRMGRPHQSPMATIPVVATE